MYKITIDRSTRVVIFKGKQVDRSRGLEVDRSTGWQVDVLNDLKVHRLQVDGFLGLVSETMFVLH